MIKKSVFEFMKEQKITNVTYGSLSKAAISLGYTILEFNRFANTKSIETLLDCLCLKDLSQTARAFSFANENNRLIFITEGISEQEKLLLLSHELGHIVLGHLSNPLLKMHAIQCEADASEFAHYLQNVTVLDKLRLNCAFNRKKLCISAAAVAALLVVAIFFIPFFQGSEQPKSQNTADASKKASQSATSAISTSKETKVDSAAITDPEEKIYVVSRAGKKYHKPTCQYVADKKNLKEYTLQELKELGTYEPCSNCIGKDEAIK